MGIRKKPNGSSIFWPIGSMYGILMVNVTIYGIHGSYGWCQKSHSEYFLWWLEWYMDDFLTDMIRTSGWMIPQSWHWRISPKSNPWRFSQTTINGGLTWLNHPITTKSWGFDQQFKNSNATNYVSVDIGSLQSLSSAAISEIQERLCVNHQKIIECRSKHYISCLYIACLL